MPSFGLAMFRRRRRRGARRKQNKKIVIWKLSPSLCAFPVGGWGGREGRRWAQIKIFRTINNFLWIRLRRVVDD